MNLVISIERRFGVSLPDSEASRVRTVADMAALVLAHLPRATGVCPTARTFFRRRSVMASAFGVDRRALHPSACVMDLCPHGLRRAWRTIRAVEPRLPRLALPPVLDTLLT